MAVEFLYSVGNWEIAMSKKFGLGLLLSMILLVTFYVTRKSYEDIVISRGMTMSFDNFHSKSLVESLKVFVGENLKPGGFDDFSDKVCNDFKSVKSVEWDFSLPGDSSLKFTGLSPVWVINDEFILVDHDSRLLLKSDFEDYDIKSLPSITISKEYCNNKLAAFVYEFLQKVPHDLARRYNIEYKDRRRIFLNSSLNQTSLYQILADQESIFDEEKIRRVEKISGNFFDIRFKGQIVAKTLKNKKV